MSGWRTRCQGDTGPAYWWQFAQRDKIKKFYECTMIVKATQVRHVDGYSQYKMM